jgi:protein-S-isoprenylcysteine O-methyltransferase Ste14
MTPDPAAVAVALYVVYLATVFAARSVLHRRRTGSTGFVGISGRPGSPEWLGGVLFAIALVLGFLAPVLQLAAVIQPLARLDGPIGHLGGFVLSLAGIVLTLAAQSAMGNSWRIGVDPCERTTLVIDGPFALVRNPIFVAMLPTALGLALLTPNAVALLGVGALLAALELQTRVVEEPYLLSAHGADYARYAGRVGRFVPGIGRLRPR